MKMYRENFGFNNFNMKKMLIVFSVYIFFFVFFLSVGFSAFQTSLVMQDISAAIKKDTDVRISGFRVESLNNNAVCSNYDYNYNKTYGDILLPDANSSVTYAVDVTNIGNTKVGISNITGLNENLKYTLSGYAIGEPIIEDGAYTLGVTMTFYITIEYPTGATINEETQPFNLDFEFRAFHTVTYHGVPGEENFPQEVMDGFDLVLTTELTSIDRLKITQDTFFLTYGEHYFYDDTINQLTVKNVSGDLLISYRDIAYLANLSSSTAYFKEPAYKVSIKNISFVDYVDITNALATYDLSENQDNSITGWITDNSADQAGTYNLYIGSIYDIYTKNFEWAFANMYGVRNISFDNLNTSECVSFNYTFYQTDINYLNLETFNTSSAISMIDMFAEMDQLETLDVSNFDTSKVSSMWYMFGGLTKLTTLDISTFNTSSVTNMAHMFSGMSKLKTINLGDKFNTSRVTNMESMFSGCEALKEINLSTFNTKSLKNAKNMFFNCKSLTTLDLSAFNTENVTDMSHMFYGMRTLNSINLTSFDTSNVTKMESMFSNCPQLTSLDLSHFNTSNVTTMKDMFKESYSLQSLNISNFDTSAVRYMDNMFYNISSIKSLDLSSFKFTNGTSLTNLFSGCNNLVEVDLRQADFSKVYSMSGMFDNVPANITVIVADEPAQTWVQNVLGVGIGNVIIYEEPPVTEPETGDETETETESGNETGNDTESTQTEIDEEITT